MALHDSAIIGFAEVPSVRRSSRDVWDIGADILADLIQTTGVEKAEIDGLILSSCSTGAGNIFWSQTTADQLGLELDFCQSVDIGGCAPTASIARAAMAIDAGLCETVLCLFTDTQVSEDNRKMRAFGEEWTAPLGYMGPVNAFGLLSTRYAHQFGLDPACLGKLAVTQREHALLNPNAVATLQKPITLEDYLSSRMISDPIRLLDCVMACDGGSGVLVTSRKSAERRGVSRIAVPVGYGERTNYRAAEPMIDPTETGHRVAGARAFAQAGLTPQDMGSVHLYDDFIIAIMMQLEMLGFCEHGQGCDFIAERTFQFDGDLPLNTGGGQISAGHVGLAGGGTNLVEAVRQLFEAGDKRQVRDTRHALVTGIGGIPYGRNWASSTALILSAEG